MAGKALSTVTAQRKGSNNNNNNNSSYLLITYYVPRGILNNLHILTHLIFKIILNGKYNS